MQLTNYPQPNNPQIQQACAPECQHSTNDAMQQDMARGKIALEKKKVMLKKQAMQKQTLPQERTSTLRAVQMPK